MKKTTIDLNEVILKKFVESLRPESIEARKQVDIGYSYDGKVAIFFEIRPDWQDSTIINHFEFAKIRYYKSRKEWNLYWMRANENWELYTPHPNATYLDKILEVIKEDTHACFFG